MTKCCSYEGLVKLSYHMPVRTGEYEEHCAFEESLEKVKQSSDLLFLNNELAKTSEGLFLFFGHKIRLMEAICLRFAEQNCFQQTSALADLIFKSKFELLIAVHGASIAVREVISNILRNDEFVKELIETTAKKLIKGDLKEAWEQTIPKNESTLNSNIRTRMLENLAKEGRLNDALELVTPSNFEFS